MGIFDNIYLTDKEKIKRNISLSDVLSIYDIAELWSDDKREKGIYMEAMYNGFKQTDLKGQECKKDNGGMVIISPYTIYQEIKVNKKDFKLWLESNKEVLPEDCLLINWWNVDFKEKKQKGNRDEKLPIKTMSINEEKKLRKVKNKEFVISEVIPYLKSVHPSLKRTTDIGKYFKNKDSYNKASDLEQRFHDICVSGGKNAIYETVYKWLLDSDEAYFIKGSEGHSSNI